PIRDRSDDAAARYGCAGVPRPLIRDTLTGELRIAECDRLADHRGAGGPREQAPAIELPGGLLRRGRGRCGWRRLLLIARRFFSQIVGKILVVLLRHLGLTLEVEVFGSERGFAFALQLTPEHLNLKRQAEVAQQDNQDFSDYL